MSEQKSTGLVARATTQLKGPEQNDRCMIPFLSFVTLLVGVPIAGSAGARWISFPSVIVSAKKHRFPGERAR